MRTLCALLAASSAACADWVSESTRSDAAFFVARDAAAWEEAWRRHDPTSAAPAVDFSQALVVGFAGAWRLERFDIGTRFGEEVPVLTVVVSPAPQPRFHAWLVPPTGVAVDFCEPCMWGISILRRFASAEIHPPPVRPVDASVLAPLVRKLGDEDLHEREEAAQRILGLGRGAVPELRKFFQDPDPEIQSRSREIARELEGQSSRPEELFRGRSAGVWFEEFSLNDGVWTWKMHFGPREPIWIVKFDARTWIFLQRPADPPNRGEEE